MAVTSPTAVTALPTPPTTADPSSFDARMDATLLAQQAMVPQINALGASVFANATDAASSAASAATSVVAGAASATSAATSAAAAATNAGAVLWVSGTAYALGARTYDPANGRIYRCSVAGSGTLSPSVDTANWSIVQSGLVSVPVTGASVTARAGYLYVLTNAAATTVTLPASPSDGDMVAVMAQNRRTDNLILRNGSLLMVDTVTGVGLSEDMVYDTPATALTFRFTNSIWRLV